MNDHPAGSLLSVNVGMPKDVAWRGRTVFTGVFKDPVTGPRRVGRLNIDGDGQGDLGGHGGEMRAVFVYQLGSYRYWERELGRSDFVYGQFGENFTVEGLGDDEVCIGDRYRIGSAVFEVSQPRVTCYRVGLRMNDPRIPALLVSHHRPGFYFRVLEEGDVEAGNDIVKLAPGQFGENFTVEGLADADVCIGDRYAIGTAVFEVTQPRVTCYRVGIRMNDPRIPALLVSHRRPGFYFRVLEEGDVEAGDDIVKVASGPEEMAVADVDALLYLPGHTRQQLLRALRIPALSPGWQSSFRALLDGDQGSGNAGLAVTSPPPAWPGFRRLTVTAITPESDSVVSIRLEDPEGARVPAPRPGQYLTLRVQPDEDARPLLRNYSLSGPPDGGFYRITVKRERDGAASGFLHTRLAVGDGLDVAAPRGTFLLDRSDAPVLLLSAGIGATPVLAMLQALVEEHSDREIWWLHGARSGREHPFAAEARALVDALPNASARVLYSRPGPDDVEGRDYDRVGRLSASALAELDPPHAAEAYICGPTPFMDELCAALAAAGLDASRIHTEPFGPAAGLTPGIAATPARPPHPPAGEPGSGPTIEFARSGLAIPWSGEYTSLLELAEACDVPVRWSCRTGVCHNCETTLIAGDLDYSPDPVEPPAEGSALICCSQPRDDVVLDL